MPSYQFKLNGTLIRGGAVVYGDGPGVISVVSDHPVGWWSVGWNNGDPDGNKKSSVKIGENEWRYENDLAFGAFNVRCMAGSDPAEPEVKPGQEGGWVVFEYRQRVAPAPALRGAKNVVVTSRHASLPRPTSKPDDGRNTVFLRTPGQTVRGVEVVAGGETVFERDVLASGKVRVAKGTRFTLAGTAFQLIAPGCTLEDIQVPVRFTGYVAYLRPTAKGFILRNLNIREGSEAEACLRLAGSNGKISRLTCISTGIGFDEKQTLTGVRGYTANAYFDHEIDNLPWQEQLEDCGVVIDDFHTRGCIHGINAMVRGDSGPLDGIVKLYHPTVKRPLTEAFEGDWNRVGVGHPNALRCVDAFLAARSAGKRREDIVAACIAAAGVTDHVPDVATSLANRDVAMGQRAYGRWSNGEALDCTFMFQPGGINEFENVDFTNVQFLVEPTTPELGGFVPGHPNRDWSMTGDRKKPAPRARFVNCTRDGKPLNLDWLDGIELKKAL